VRDRRLLNRQQVILVVGQSGSMAGSMIHSVVTAVMFVWAAWRAKACPVASDIVPPGQDTEIVH